VLEIESRTREHAEHLARNEGLIRNLRSFVDRDVLAQEFSQGLLEDKAAETDGELL
jgi:hypothetical protein